MRRSSSGGDVRVFLLLSMLLDPTSCMGPIIDGGVPPTTPPRGDDPDAGTIEEDAGPPRIVDAGAPPPPIDADAGPPPVGAVAASVSSATSASLRVSWPSATQVTSIEVELGTEPPDEFGVLDGPTVTYSTDATATSFTINGLAANTDAFIIVRRVRAGIAEWGVAYGRTTGGPGATLATSLQSVHLAGRNVLRVVVSNPRTRYSESSATYTGNQGSAWQSGTWTVARNDGTRLNVTAVRRETIPVGQPDYPVGFEMYGDGNIVDLQHTLDLELADDVGSREILTVTHSGTSETALAFTLPFSDRYLETPSIQLNQLGYSPRATRRWAYVSSYLGNGGGLPLSRIGTQVKVLREPHDMLVSRSDVTGFLPIATRSTADSHSGTPVGEIDLSTVPAAEGVRYRIYVPGVGISYPTAVSHEATFRAFFTIARGLYHNRWCGNLAAEYTEWTRAEDHCNAYFVTGTSYRAGQFNSATSRTNQLPVRGGHHDAGDFDIRPFHVVVGQYLMRGYEMNTGAFADHQLQVPESGNGIPDLLDEALWSIAGWEALQNSDGSVRAGVESYADPRGIYFANQDALPYWTFDPEPWHTAYVAALFAQAARLVRPFDTTRAAGLEDRARRAYGSTIAASAPQAYRLYAASELAALTGEDRFFTDFETLWTQLNVWGRGAFDHVNSMVQIYPGSFDENTPVMADFVMAYVRSPDALSSIVATTRTELRGLADHAADAVLNSPLAHRNARQIGETPDWGRATSTGRHVDYIYQALQLGGLPADVQQRYVDAMSVAADYLLGANPMGTSYVTGLGSRMPRQPLHLDSLSGMASGRAPVPGIPVFGPVNTLPAVYYYRPVTDAHYPVFTSRPLDRRYADSRTSVNTAEFTVWENQSPLTELFAALAPTGMMPPASWFPGGEEHQATLTSY